MKKNYIIISTLLSVATFTMAGCGATSSVNTNANTNTNAAAVPANANIVNTNTTTVDTSSWKIYKNDTLSLSFNYPKNWKLASKKDGDDFTEVLDNNDIYDHQLVNFYVQWSNRHEDVLYDSGVTNPTLDRWLSCDYIYDLQSQCNKMLINGIEVIKREGQIEPPFGDHYVVLAYKYKDFTVVLDGRSLLRESSSNTGNTNLDGLQYINAIIKTMNIN